VVIRQSYCSSLARIETAPAWSEGRRGRHLFRPEAFGGLAGSETRRDRSPRAPTKLHLFPAEWRNGDVSDLVARSEHCGGAGTKWTKYFNWP
jgi:hypothetical protein